jgi:16S rRNA (cytidine1402-2'-O)-methyltransferase
MLAALKQSLQPNTRLAISSGLTLASAHIVSQSIKQWKHASTTLDNATPVVFAIGR